MTVASDRSLVDSVIEALSEVITVGDAIAPDTSPPYCIVYPMPSGGLSGTIDDTHRNEDFVVQTTSVGTTREQAQWVADKVKVRMLAGGFDIPGRTLLGPVRMDVGAGVQRDDDTAGPPLFYAVHRYRLPTTPA